MAALVSTATEESEVLQTGKGARTEPAKPSVRYAVFRPRVCWMERTCPGTLRFSNHFARLFRII